MSKSAEVDSEAVRVSNLSRSDLVNLYNSLTGNTVTRFGDRKIGERRLLAEIERAGITLDAAIAGLPAKQALAAGRIRSAR